MRRMHRRRGERGAAAVEAALILPVVVLLVFGMIEMAFVMKDNVAVTSSARVGARIASAAPGSGEAVCDGEVPCAPKTVPRFAQLAADAMQTNGSAVDMQKVDDIWVYRANEAGWPSNFTEQPETWANCQVDCVRFTWSDARRAFRYASGEWSEVAGDVCATEGERVGVLLRTTHPWITGFPFVPGIGDNIFVDDNAVMSFEPLTIEDRC